MSKQEWTKESDWFLGREGSLEGAESITIRRDPLVSSVAYFGTKANARRAYDCVMACKGIIDPRGYLLDYIPAQKRELELYIKANASLKAENERLREALRWYEAQARLCRKVTSEGRDAQMALDNDGGRLARQALSEEAR